MKLLVLWGCLLLAVIGGSRAVSAAQLVVLGPTVISTEFHGEDRPLNLPRARRLIVSSGDRLGTTVQWSAGPFVNTRNNRFAVDTGLELIPVAPERNRTAVVLTARDQTHLEHGDRQAVVSAAVMHPGVMGMELQVTFLPKDASALASGVYTTRVVGTITGH